MDNNLKDQIANSIRKEIDLKKMSQNQWAKENEISKSHMSNILNADNWEKVGERIWTKLAGLVLQQGWGLFETSNYKITTKACQDAQKNNRLNAIYAYTGAGKTTALEDYKKSNPNVWYLVCRSSFGTKDLVYRIASAMGIQPKGGRTIDVEDQIIDKLISTPNALLILDSVSKLRKEAALQFIGDLAEATEHRAGIVIGGTEFLRTHFEKMVQRDKRGFREFDRRIYAWTRLKDFASAPVQKEIVNICMQQGITNPEQIRLIKAKATCFGTLKSCVDKLRKAALS